MERLETGENSPGGSITGAAASRLSMLCVKIISLCFFVLSHFISQTVLHAF